MLENLSFPCSKVTAAVITPRFRQSLGPELLMNGWADSSQIKEGRLFVERAYSQASASGSNFGSEAAICAQCFIVMALRAPAGESRVWAVARQGIGKDAMAHRGRV